MRRPYRLALACLLPCVVRAQDPAQTPHKPTFSPDKKWEYRVEAETAVIVKAGSDATDLDLSEEIGYLAGETGKLVWAPDSRRFAFNCRKGGKYYGCDLYELVGGAWKKLPELEGNAKTVNQIIKRSKQQQMKRLGAKKDADPNSVMDQWRVRRWLDNDTFEAYARSEARVMISPSSEDPEYFQAAVLFTVKCDNRGGWKVVEGRLLSDAEDEKINEEE